MSFNRRQNRIAGPGFHLNVRYDDQTMAEAMSVRPTTNLLQAGRTRRENFDVKESELLVCMKKGAMYHDGYTHCFSFANGLKSSMPGAAGKTGTSTFVEEDILSQVQYVGVASTEYQPTKAYSEQGFVAQVGGVVTLINEGPDQLKPGDSVSLGLNLKINKRVTHDKGIPRDKIRFCLVKTKVGDNMINEAILNANLNLSAEPRTTPVAELQEIMKEIDAVKVKSIAAASIGDMDAFNKENMNLGKLYEQLTEKQADAMGTKVADLKMFLEAYQELNKRVIGKCASYARQGDRVEVILQPRNPY